MMESATDPECVCAQCRGSIPCGAKLCQHCKSYQDWRRWFSLPTSVLALLTALISVVGLVVPPLKTAFHTPRSDAYLSMPSLDGTTLRVVAVNRGDAPASLVRARIESEYLAGATKVRLRNDADAIILPGAKLLTFDIIPLLDEDQSYSGSLEAMTAVIGRKSLPKTEILFGIAQSLGSLDVLRYPIDNEGIFRLLRENADRCSAIGTPNFTNGCIGNGMPDTKDSGRRAK